MRDGSGSSERYPSKSNILKQLELRLSLANEDDLMLVAFSGHGIMQEGNSYLCPADATFTDLAGTCVPLKEVMACRARQKVLLVDACRNEAPALNVRAASNIRGFSSDVQAPPRGVRFMTSCEEGQFSAEDPKLKRGVFMHYVVKGLKGAADREAEGNRNGKVSLDELYAYAHQETKLHAARSHAIVQRPWMQGESVGVLEMAVVPTDVLDVTGFDAVAMRASRKSQRKIAEHIQEAALNLSRKNYDKAIASHSTIIDAEFTDDAQRRSAKAARAAAYVARGRDADLSKAVADYKSAGLDGARLTIRTDNALLRVKQGVRGSVAKNQRVLITHVNGDWLWVKSVDGDKTRQGYITKNDVLEPITKLPVPQGIRRSPHQLAQRSSQPQPSARYLRGPHQGYQQPTARYARPAPTYRGNQGFNHRPSPQYRGGPSDGAQIAAGILQIIGGALQQ